MAARITKLFLQNCLEARAPVTVGKKNANGNGLKTGKLAKTTAKAKVQAKTGTNNRRKNKTKSKSGVRFLEAAQQEQKTSDKTKENLRKLKTRANDKSKRLMAKALEKRQALRL